MYLINQWFAFVIEWVSDCCSTQINNFTIISLQEQVTINEMMTTLYLTNTLNCIFIVLAHWNNSQQVDIMIHSRVRHLDLILCQPVSVGRYNGPLKEWDTLTWFWVNQSQQVDIMVHSRARHIDLILCQPVSVGRHNGPLKSETPWPDSVSTSLSR